MSAPSQIIDLSRWKLTLPVEGASGKPLEKQGTVLVGYSGPWFRAGGDEASVVFSAPVNGFTTKGSSYPRSELREMNPDGSKADWSSSEGCHILTVVEAFTVLPSGRPNVVGAQIHDADDDVSVFRLEGTKLYVTRGDDPHFKLIDPAYKLGTKYEARFVVWRDKVSAYYNGRLVAEIPGRFSGAYFKAGAYTQANCGNASPCSSTNVGEVTVYGLSVSHTASLPPQAPPSTPPPVEPPVTEPLPPTPPPATPPPAGTPQVVMIIRHGEKPKDKKNHSLDPRGRERALKIRDLFTAVTLKAGLSRPARLLASKGNTSSLRMVETLTPLQRALGLAMNTAYDSEVQQKQTAAWLAAQPGNTLACLEHSAIVKTAGYLGKTTPAIPKKWPSNRFDVVWVFTRPAGGGTWSFVEVPEELLPGDKATGIGKPTMAARFMGLFSR